LPRIKLTGTSNPWRYSNAVVKQSRDPANTNESHSGKTCKIRFLQLAKQRPLPRCKRHHY
jgi:hypothetical protein